MTNCEYLDGSTLPFVKNDLTRMITFLLTQTLHGEVFIFSNLTKEECELLRDTVNPLIKKIRSLTDANGKKLNHQIKGMLYYSGHAVEAFLDGELYICCYKPGDTEKNDHFMIRGLIDAMYGVFKGEGSKPSTKTDISNPNINIVVILDCCRTKTDLKKGSNDTEDKRILKDEKRKQLYIWFAAKSGKTAKPKMNKRDDREYSWLTLKITE